MNTTRIGPRMRELQAIVSAAPGLSKAAALRAAGLPDRGLGAHRPIERAEAAELIICVSGHPCRLYATPRDRVIAELRDELLGDPTPERAVEILAEVGRLQAERTATWTR